MAHKAPVVSATMQKKKEGKMKKNKRKWINLKDKSQRWNHQKKLRDIRARTAFKKQCMKEGIIEENGKAGNSSHLEEVTEREGGRKDGRKQRSYFSSVSCYDVSEGCGSLTADPDEFLERLYNPSYSKEKKSVEEANRAQQKEKVVSGEEEQSEEIGRRGSTAAVHLDTSIGAADTVEQGSLSLPTPKREKRGKKAKEKEEDAQRDIEDEEEEADADSSYLREGDITSGRRKKSRRLASYSPQSAATYGEVLSFSEEKGRSKQAGEFSTKRSVGFVSKGTALGVVGDRASALVEGTSSDVGRETSDAHTKRKISKFTGNSREELRVRNQESQSQEEEESRRPSPQEDAGALSKLQVPALPKGMFYPFRNAMKEAARRKAAQEEERKRREEEQARAEKEKEISRRKRAKQRRQLVARTSKGQPVMKNVMQILLNKIRESA